MTKRIDDATGVETVGHEWDGIEELNNPLPRWWLWSFYLTILFAIGYVIVYPAIPMLHAGTQGLWGWTSRGQLAQETSLAQKQRAQLVARLAATPIDTDIAISPTPFTPAPEPAPEPAPPLSPAPPPR